MPKKQSNRGTNFLLSKTKLSFSDFDYTDCMDPAMKQQIVDSGVCTSNAPPQQIVDQMMLQINRANWLFVAFDDFWELDFYPVKLDLVISRA